MGEIDSSYQTKVGFEQNAELIFLKSDGKLKFFDTDYTGSELKAIMAAHLQRTSNLDQTIIKSSGGDLSVVNIPTNGHVFIQFSAGGSNTSAWLNTPAAGDDLILVIRNPEIESVCSVFISMSLCSLVGIESADLSSISLHTSEGSAGYVHLHCYTASEWSVLANNGNCYLERSD